MTLPAFSDTIQSAPLIAVPSPQIGVPPPQYNFLVEKPKSQLEAAEKCGFYGVCCVLHGLIKYQMKKYFKEPIHQEIS